MKSIHLADVIAACLCHVLYACSCVRVMTCGSICTVWTAEVEWSMITCDNMQSASAGEMCSLPINFSSRCAAYYEQPSSFFSFDYAQRLWNVSNVVQTAQDRDTEKIVQKGKWVRVFLWRRIANNHDAPWLTNSQTCLNVFSSCWNRILPQLITGRGLGSALWVAIHFMYFQPHKLTVAVWKLFREMPRTACGANPSEVCGGLKYPAMLPSVVNVQWRF